MPKYVPTPPHPNKPGLYKERPEDRYNWCSLCGRFHGCERDELIEALRSAINLLRLIESLEQDDTWESSVARVVEDAQGAIDRATSTLRVDTQRG